MLARSVLLLPAILVLALSTATDAEARRLKLFGSAKAAAPANPQAVGAARPAAPSPVVAPTSRSNTFFFVGSGRGAPAAPATAAPAEGPGRAQDETRPMIAVLTDSLTPDAPPKPTRQAYGFETLSAPVRGFEIVTFRN